MKSSIFRLSERLIKGFRTEGLKEKIETFYKSGRLSQEEYNELNKMLEEAISTQPKD